MSLEIFLEENVKPITKAQWTQIQSYYDSLKGKDKDYLVKELGSRLDNSHAKSEPKQTLISQAMRNKFGKKVDAWSMKKIEG